MRYLHDNGDARMHPCPRYSLISRYHIPARINENIAFLIEFALPPPRCAAVREREEGEGRRDGEGWKAEISTARYALVALEGSRIL